MDIASGVAKPQFRGAAGDFSPAVFDGGTGYPGAWKSLQGVATQKLKAWSAETLEDLAAKH